MSKPVNHPYPKLDLQSVLGWLAGKSAEDLDCVGVLHAGRRGFGDD